MTRLFRVFTWLLLAWTVRAHATTLVAGTTPDSTVAFAVENDSSHHFSYEQLFTLSTGAQITGLNINAASFSTQTLRVQLFSGLGLEGTGTLLQNFDISVPGGFDGLLPDIPTITTAKSFSLEAGSYSLLISLPNRNSSGDFIYQNLADSSNTPFGSLGGTHWSTGIISPGNIVFDLAGTPVSAVPEPAFLLLFATGLIGVGAKQTWKRRQAKKTTA
jgi:hypothetical protein